VKPLVYRKSRRVRGTEPERHRLHIAKGDTVRVISGAHRGREGKVLKVYPKLFRVEVEGIVHKKHKRANTADAQGGIIEIPAPLAASNVMLIDPKSGEPTRVRRRLDADGVAERVSVKSGQPILRVRAS
jgi:large subunit ribosomal protein L24